MACSNPAERAKAWNLSQEQGVSRVRQEFFEAKVFSAPVPNWDRYIMGHASYVGTYVKTDVLQPHTFQDIFEPISAGGIDEAQYIVCLESLVRPMTDYGCSFDDFSRALPRRISIS